MTEAAAHWGPWVDFLQSRPDLAFVETISCHLCGWTQPRRGDARNGRPQRGFWEETRACMGYVVAHWGSCDCPLIDVCMECE